MQLRKQDRFFSCYLGKQGTLNHLAYLRLAKVYMILEALRRTRTPVSGKRLFDYGFGAGTLFRHLPVSCQIFGVELGEETVAEVAAMLSKLGHSNTTLQAIDFSGNWQEHALLKEKYDIIVCSHVLEHLEQPVEILEIFKSCLSDNGIIITPVPVNELKANPHHVQIVSKSKMTEWATSAGLNLKDYFESDSSSWPWQPIFTYDKGFIHLLARSISLLYGLFFTLVGLRGWEIINRLFSLFLPATQACAVLTKK
jgi:2-polyprenyl-3-methyl-5-hydroxy-6-metoxy-1,4-benzoquinol methylase